MQATLDTERINSGKQCPYCGGDSEYVDSIEVYVKKSYGMIYLCRPCGAYVGVHKGTNVALGRLADAFLRHWRGRAHAHFDPIWDALMKQHKLTKDVARTGAYQWLSEKMGTPMDKTHIGMFDPYDCMKIVKICGKKDIPLIINKILNRIKNIC